MGSDTMSGAQPLTEIWFIGAPFQPHSFWGTLNQKMPNKLIGQISSCGERFKRKRRVFFKMRAWKDERAQRRIWPLQQVGCQQPLQEQQLDYRTVAEHCLDGQLELPPVTVTGGGGILGKEPQTFCGIPSYGNEQLRTENVDLQLLHLLRRRA